MKKENLYLRTVIEKLDPWFINELKDDEWYLDWISSFVGEALGFPDEVKDITPEQRAITFQTTLDYIYHLIKYRGCKVCYMKMDDHAFWELSPEEAVEKIKADWIRLGDNASPADQPWFTIDKDK